MILHVVIFTWKDGVTRDQVAAFSAAVDALGETVGLFQSLQHGPDLAMREGNGDYVLIATFDTKDAWRAYQSHPAHLAFVANFVRPLQHHRTATQIEI